MQDIDLPFVQAFLLEHRLSISILTFAAIVLLAWRSRSLSILGFGVVSFIAVASALTLWSTFFPAETGLADGSATLIAGMLSIAVAGIVALWEYRNVQTRASIAGVSQLLNEIVGCIEEIDDIAYVFKKLKWPKATDSYKKPFERENFDDLERLSKELERKFNVSEFFDLSVLLPGRGRTQAEYAGPGPSDDESIYPSHQAELNAVALKINPSSYERTLLELRALGNRRYWTDALIAVGEFYEQRSYVTTILERAKDLLDVKTNGVVNWEDEYRRLIFHYWINLMALNLLHGPHTVSALLLALASQLPKSSSRTLARIARRLVKRYEINKEMLEKLVNVENR